LGVCFLFLLFGPRADGQTVIPAASPTRDDVVFASFAPPDTDIFRGLRVKPHSGRSAFAE
jgi:hypothetical protein